MEHFWEVSYMELIGWGFLLSGATIFAALTWGCRVRKALYQPYQTFLPGDTEPTEERV